MDFMIDIEPARDGVVVVRVAGEIDADTELRLRDALLAAVGHPGAPHVVVDLARAVLALEPQTGSDIMLPRWRQ